MSSSYKSRFHPSYIEVCLYIYFFYTAWFLGWRTTGQGKNLGWVGSRGDNPVFLVRRVEFWHFISIALFHFSFLKCCLFLFALFYFIFSWSRDSVPMLNTGISACRTKTKCALTQTAVKQHLTTKFAKTIGMKIH